MKNVIEVRKLVKTYYLSDEVSVQAIRGISLSVQKGEFLAIMGASGSGKSTFMNILGFLDSLTSGSYLLDGVEQATLDDDRKAEIRNTKIGFVFQGFNLLSRTSALENVELPMIYRGGARPQEVREKARELLAMVGLSGREDHHPNRLSGGEQQRVAIARSLINDPAIILADEPTGNLDTRNTAEIMGIFTRLNRDLGITVILVTHEPEVADYTRRKIVFRDGLILQDVKLGKSSRRGGKKE
ncbi:MAG: ABC transporter ATP-binding protein [Spirochaetes bacterium]|jgi:putative ABC transport system ATP-binding protein|nr:ABC transporter ATP-binding protein [Spirochaetota bacterium]